MLEHLLASTYLGAQGSACSDLVPNARSKRTNARSLASAHKTTLLGFFFLSFYLFTSPCLSHPQWSEHTDEHSRGTQAHTPSGIDPIFQS